MTTAADVPSERVRDYMQLWAEALAMVLGQIASAPFPVTQSAAPREPFSASPVDVYLIATAGGAARGELSLRIPEASALAMAKLFAGEEARPAELVAEDRSALEELLRQVAGHIVTSAGPRFQDIALTVALREAPTWAPAARGWLESTPGTPCAMAMEWQMSAALSTALSQMPEAHSPGESQPASALPKGRAVDLFLDLELDVTLRFGGRNILLKEVLDLGPGSVLELDREIHDAADLLLDGKLIARGEVVMVNGNYGLRVTETLTSAQA